MQMKIERLLFAIATFIPGVTSLRVTSTGGTDNARYCYSVWLRHLVLAHQNNLCTVPPPVVAELGPGDSLGIGLAALLSGVDLYYGLDVVNYAAHQRNISIFNELVELFRQRAPIPGGSEFPQIKPYLDSHDFPLRILTEDRLRVALAEDRITQIRHSLAHPNVKDALIKYVVPWYSVDAIQRASVDMIFSQAVLEHVDDLPGTYQAMAAWLKPNGFMSHQIDFRCHGTAGEWNGHWTYSDWYWRLMRGKRAYLINRQPYSTHTRLLQETGFKVVGVKKVETPSKIGPEKLASRFRNMSYTDLTISGAFIQTRQVSHSNGF